MADVVIDATVANTYDPRCAWSHMVVSTSASVLYAFGLDGTLDFGYWKSSDSGATWGTHVVLANGTHTGCAIWFDKWTRGDSGTKVHCTWAEDTDATLHYRALDTSDDSLGTDTTVYTGTDVVSPTRASITKARGGNLYIAFDWRDAGNADQGFYRSTDSGANWTARTAIQDAVGEADWYILTPGEYADSQDIDAVYQDVDADELTVKTYDDSANSWAESSALASVVESGAVASFMAACVSLLDGAVFIFAWNAFDAAGADLLGFRWHSGAFTALTNVVSDTDDCVGVTAFIDQLNHVLYVAYLGKSDGSEVVGTNLGVYYKKSYDGGITWSAEQTMAETATLNLTGIFSGMGGIDSRFLVTWFDDTNNDLITSTTNSVAITARRQLALTGVGI